MINVPVRGTITYLSYLRNCADRVVSRFSQKSGDLGPEVSVGVSTTNTGRRITHTLGIISLGSVYAPNGISEFSVEKAFYLHLKMVVDSCPKGDTLIVLGDFNATTGTDRDDCGQ